MRAAGVSAPAKGDPLGAPVARGDLFGRRGQGATASPARHAERDLVAREHNEPPTPGGEFARATASRRPRSTSGTYGPRVCARRHSARRAHNSFYQKTVTYERVYNAFIKERFITAALRFCTTGVWLTLECRPLKFKRIGPRFFRVFRVYNMAIIAAGV